MIQLGQTQDGRLIIGSNQPFPADVKHVEYYREQRLFVLAYETQEAESDLMPCEISADIAPLIGGHPEILILTAGKGGAEPSGYQVPLIQIGA